MRVKSEREREKKLNAVFTFNINADGIEMNRMGADFQFQVVAAKANMGLNGEYD